MPLYEYECQTCKQPSELLVQRPDAKVQCPECGSEKMVKQLSVIGSPVISSGASSCSTSVSACGKPACASGCMFGG